MKLYAAAVAALKGKDFEFSCMSLIAKTKTEARKIAKKACLERFPKKDGYMLHEVSVTNAITEVKA